MYSALMYKAQQMDANFYVGTVEGHPTFEEIRDMLVAKNKRSLSSLYDRGRPCHERYGR